MWCETQRGRPWRVCLTRERRGEFDASDSVEKLWVRGLARPRQTMES
jgi:hypothetical protein